MFNYTTNFEDCFKTAQHVASLMQKLRNIDISVEYGNDPFYDEDYGIFYPLQINGNVIAYLVVQVSKNKAHVRLKLDKKCVEELAKTNALRLLPKTVKSLNTVAAGNKLCSDDYHGRSPLVRLKSSEVIKAMILGYISCPSDNELMSIIINSNYNLQSMFGAKTNVDSQLRLKTIINTLNGPPAKTAPGGYDGWSGYNSNSASKLIVSSLTRSSKAFDNTHVLKWRKPSKNSLWPWTLDHHWFMVQESPISLANCTYKALLGTGSNTHSKKDKIDNQYPVFSKSNGVEQGRKALELFFNTVLNPRSKGKWGDLVYLVQNMRWVSDNPCFLIPKLCLVLGVVPSFNSSGKFEKFVSMAGNFAQNNEKLYLELTALNIDQGHDLEPFIASTMALCYDLGIVKLDAIEKNLGVVNRGTALLNNPNYFKVNVGKTVVCCVPKKFSYDITEKAITKFNVKRLEAEKAKDPVFNI